MKRFFLLLFALSLCSVNAEQRVSTPEEFLRMVRTPPGRESWGLLTGSATHKRRGADSSEAPIRFSVLFTKARTIAQIVFNGQEIYDVAQSYAPPYAGSIETRELRKDYSLKDFGLRPEDLTMNFIFWPFRRELSGESIRGIACRVMTFESSSGTESVKVFISADYFFPVKVEWHNVPENKIGGEAFRTLEVTSFKKSGDLWIVGSLSIYGPGWRTVVKFPEAKAGLTKDGVDKELFQ